MIIDIKSKLDDAMCGTCGVNPACYHVVLNDAKEDLYFCHKCAHECLEVVPTVH